MLKFKTRPLSQFMSFNNSCYSCVLQDSAQEGVITRDIHRTFPAHDYFKDSDGDGQDSLYKICKVSLRKNINQQYSLSVSSTHVELDEILYWIIQY